MGTNSSSDRLTKLSDQQIDEQLRNYYEFYDFFLKKPFSYQHIKIPKDSKTTPSRSFTKTRIVKQKR